MLYTWKVVFDAFVSKLLDCKASGASFAELLYLRERPWSKALTLGSVSESWTQALCSVWYALIRAQVLLLSSVLQRHIPDRGEMELGGWAQLMNVSGDGTRWVSSVTGKGRRISYLLKFWLCSYLSPASATILETLGLIFPCTSVLVHKPEHCSS